MHYPHAGAWTSYVYNPRGWLDSLTAKNDTATLFRQVLSYAPTGQIMGQTSQHIGLPELQQDYSYDNTRQLTQWINNLGGGPDTTRYFYDAVGNRDSLLQTGLTTNYLYQDANGPNRLTRTGEGGGRMDYFYNANGSMDRRDRWAGGGVLAPYVAERETFAYNAAGLVERFKREDLAGSFIPGCAPFTATGYEDWRYRYSPQGEREQKRLYYSFNGDSCGTAHQWVYYALAGTKQLAVYEGTQTTTVNCGGGNQEGDRNVYLYPVEYLSYGGGSTPAIVTRPGIGKEYRVIDHLGSTRLTLFEDGSTVSQEDYAPFGGALIFGSERAGYIGKEKDKETALGDYGVRKYNDALGRFTSIDPLWEKQPFFTPYHYCENNSLLLTDPNGKEPNKKQATNLEAVVEIIRKAEQKRPNASNSKILAVMENYFMGKKKPRYLYTNAYGWIDMRHFFATARWSDDLNPTIANNIGYLGEIVQSATGQSSGFSPEDVPSNYLGSYFVETFYDPDSDKPVSQQFKEFIEALGTVFLPEWAGKDYEVLPDKASSGSGSDGALASDSDYGPGKPELEKSEDEDDEE